MTNDGDCVNSCVVDDINDCDAVEQYNLYVDKRDMSSADVRAICIKYLD